MSLRLDLQGPDAEPQSAPTLPPRLAVLAQRLQEVSDFPALSAQVLRVTQVADQERQSLRALTEEILKDAALTSKVLQVVNAARYAGHQEGVGTVSRAISLLGVVAVRRVALSLVVLEHLENQCQAQWLRQAYAKTLLAAELAVTLTAGQADPEDAFLATLFQLLGPMVALYHFSEVTDHFKGERLPSYQELDQQTRMVLGVRLDELGGVVAGLWTLPDPLRRCMVRPDGRAPMRPVHDVQERLRWVGRAAADMADVMYVPGAQAQGAIDRLMREYLPVLGLGQEVVQERVETARGQWRVTAAALGLEAQVATEDCANSPSSGAELESSSASVAKEPVVMDTDLAERVLTAGLDDMTAAMLDGAAPRDVARIGMEIVSRALGLERVVLFRRDAAMPDAVATCRVWTSLGRFGGDMKAHMILRPVRSEDPLCTLLAVDKDVWLPSVEQTQWIQRLPVWLPAPQKGALLLLPLHQGKQLQGVMYADGTDGRLMPPEIPGRLLLQSIRRLLVMAMQSTHP